MQKKCVFATRKIIVWLTFTSKDATKRRLNVEKKDSLSNLNVYVWLHYFYFGRKWKRVRTRGWMWQWNDEIERKRLRRTKRRKKRKKIYAKKRRKTNLPWISFFYLGRNIRNSLNICCFLCFKANWGQSFFPHFFVVYKNGSEWAKGINFNLHFKWI